MSWTEEKVEKLKELWGKGNTASQIAEIGVPSKLYFEKEIEKYSFMWREGGQFSTGKYIKKDD